MELTRRGKRALVIANACDLLPEGERAPRVQREIAALRALGFEAGELDLRDYFPGGHSQADLAERLAACDLAWARGGNSFVYRRALRQSGCDDLLRASLSNDTIVYAGYSGGIAVMAPSLAGIEMVNDAVAVPQGYDPAILWEGLGMIAYWVVPHYKSNHPASPGMEAVIGYFTERRMPFKVLRDGEAIIVEGDREEIVS